MIDYYASKNIVMHHMIKATGSPIHRRRILQFEQVKLKCEGRFT